MVALGRVCVFCGSSTPPDPRYADLARSLGALLADRGTEVVYGGRRVGLMGQLADAALEAGGRVIGVLPVALAELEIAHSGLSELHRVGTMHERKALMYDLADGFVALPGGLGTLDELAEVATWSQLGLHRKPIVLLDVDRYWAALLDQLDRMVATGFVRQANRELLHWAASPQEAVAVLETARPEAVQGWIDPDQR
ncbi:MAG TPA: TIGR00730 family Rossman fold protein [Acidimicrobiales bacterium]|nr:TIGR00730 family Rossman fold protein [Acidimicrobiales bacterium]